MKNFLMCLAMLVLLGSIAKAEEGEIRIMPVEHTTCSMVKQYVGVWHRECPLDAVVVGVDVRVAGNNFLWTYVKCERQELVCKKEVTEDLE